MKISIKNDRSLCFGIHRKPTHTDKYLNFNSYNPVPHKNSVIRTLVHRAETLCDAENKNQEIDHIYKVLRNNEYPQNSIDKIVRKVRNNVGNNPPPEPSQSFVSIPYISGTSERISCILRWYI